MTQHFFSLVSLVSFYSSSVFNCLNLNNDYLDNFGLQPITGMSLMFPPFPSLQFQTVFFIHLSSFDGRYGFETLILFFSLHTLRSDWKNSHPWSIVLNLHLAVANCCILFPKFNSSHFNRARCLKEGHVGSHYCLVHSMVLIEWGSGRWNLLLDWILLNWKTENRFWWWAYTTRLFGSLVK